MFGGGIVLFCLKTATPLFSALNQKLQSIKQVVKREACVTDALQDILRLRNTYNLPVGEMIRYKLEQDQMMPFQPEDVAHLVRELADLGETEVKRAKKENCFWTIE